MELIPFNSENTTTSLIKEEKHEVIVKAIQSYLNEPRFNHIVTSDNIAQVKKDNAELNKSKKYIADTTKEIVERESKTINKFKENSKEYQQMIEDKRLDRIEKIEVFENETRAAIQLEAQAYYQDNKESLRDYFDKVDLSDMTKLSYLTSTGKLSKEAKSVIDSKIQECMLKQNRYDLRVSNLKVVCFERGLTEPLTENHIQGIVFIDDEQQYSFKLDTLINDELIRIDRLKKQIEEKAREDERKKIEEENKIEIKEKVSKELQQKEVSSKIEHTKEEINQEPDVKKTLTTEKGNKVYLVTANLKIEVKSHITQEQVKSAVNKKLIEAGVTTLQSIEIKEML